MFNKFRYYNIIDILFKVYCTYFISNIYNSLSKKKYIKNNSTQTENISIEENKNSFQNNSTQTYDKKDKYKDANTQTENIFKEKDDYFQNDDIPSSSFIEVGKYLYNASII